MKRLTFISMLVIALFLLAACATMLKTETTISLDQNEKWELTYMILFDGTDFADYKQSVDDEITTFTATYAMQGITVKTKELSLKDGNYPYQVVLSGKGIDKLNEVIGVPGAFTKETEGKRTSYEFSAMGSEIYTGQLYIGQTADFTFTLDGMNIITTNGSKNSKTSVTWTDPYMNMTATMTPANSAGSIPWWVILIIVFGLAAVVFIILLATGAFKKKPQPLYGMPPGYLPQYAPPIPAAGSVANMPPPVMQQGAVTPPPPPAEVILPPIPTVTAPPPVELPQVPEPPTPPGPDSIDPSAQKTVLVDRKPEDKE